MVPPGQVADDAIGALSIGADSSTVPLQIAAASRLDDLGRIFMSLFLLRGDLGLLIDDLGGVDHHVLLPLRGISIELQHV